MRVTPRGPRTQPPRYCTHIPFSLQRSRVHWASKQEDEEDDMEVFSIRANPEQPSPPDRICDVSQKGWAGWAGPGRIVDGVGFQFADILRSDS